CDEFVHPQNSFQSFRFSTQKARRYQSILFARRETGKATNDAMPPKVSMVAPDGKQAFDRTSITMLMASATHSLCLISPFALHFLLPVYDLGNRWGHKDRKS